MEGWRWIFYKSFSRSVASSSLLVKGLRWRVGDGYSIRVFQDQWLPRPSTFRPISPDPGLDLRVSDLLDRNHLGWDHSKLNQFMLPIDRNIVASIPHSLSAITPVVGPSSRPPLCGDWIPPPPSCLKLNSAMVTHKSSRYSALGTIIRDDKGRIIAARARKMLGAFSKDSGVLLALREGLLLAKFLGVPVWVAEIDFSPDVKNLMSDVGVNACRAISKEGNSLACNLGKSVFLSRRELFLLENSFCCLLSYC
ncbi:hypothetical protein EZV62_015706 [Acer yangbiense]|uniref:RNase H type-1 domain-containing protein n=1 Tax=Acer yangbiense TaxID=1000413 RepID=A0A5C7HLH8_9ROSI|nr:hypothetical protein EZV62_015706 [Acer yangbiense]